MSNLIPTPIVDKNGVQSIRHKKQTTFQPLAGRHIPPVSSPATITGHSTLSTGQLIDLIYPNRTDFPSDAATITSELNMIRKVSPEVLRLVEELIPAGTTTGASLVRLSVDNVVTRITYSRKMYGDRSNYQDTLASAARLDAQEVSRVWNCGNVMEESGFTRDTGVPGRLRNVVYQEFRRELPRLNVENPTDRFWRGAAAFTILDKECDITGMDDKEKTAAKREFYREAKKFIDYAGKHKDIGLVIRTAKKRDTLVVSELRDIIDRGNAVPSMRDGVL